MNQPLQEKTKCAIIGSGKIGCDLLVKIQRSKYLDCVLMAGQREESEGLKFAKGKGVNTSAKSIQAVEESNANIVFDATTAVSAKEHAKFLKDRFVIDLTPSKVGMMCSPTMNLKEAIKAKNVNLVSCGFQVVMPMITKLKDPIYIEVVTTVASKSAGMGTRENISEYLETTAKAITKFTGAKAKAILVINPMDINMHNTVYAIVKGRTEPIVLQKEIIGAGDNIPKFSGNLDTINQNAVRIAEEYAKNIRFNN